jgi:hypothetical protein
MVQHVRTTNAGLTPVFPQSSRFLSLGRFVFAAQKAVDVRGTESVRADSVLVAKVMAGALGRRKDMRDYRQPPLGVIAESLTKRLFWHFIRHDRTP